jgi:hypothetical protein
MKHISALQMGIFKLYTKGILKNNKKSKKFLAPKEIVIFFGFLSFLPLVH